MTAERLKLVYKVVGEDMLGTSYLLFNRPDLSNDIHRVLSKGKLEDKSEEKALPKKISAVLFTVAKALTKPPFAGNKLNELLPKEYIGEDGTPVIPIPNCDTPEELADLLFEHALWIAMGNDLVSPEPYTPFNCQPIKSIKCNTNG